MSVKSSAKVRKEVWLALGATAVVVAGVWPWMQLKQIAVKQQAVDQQWMQVQTLAAQAQQLRSQAAPASTATAAQQLPSVVSKVFGDAAQLSATGDSGVLTLQLVPAAMWVEGLETLRQSAGVRVAQARLDVQPQGVSGRVELQWAGQ